MLRTPCSSVHSHSHSHSHSRSLGQERARARAGHTGSRGCDVQILYRPRPRPLLIPLLLHNSTQHGGSEWPYSLARWLVGPPASISAFSPICKPWRTQHTRRQRTSRNAPATDHHGKQFAQRMLHLTYISRQRMLHLKYISHQRMFHSTLHTYHANGHIHAPSTRFLNLASVCQKHTRSRPSARGLLRMPPAEQVWPCYSGRRGFAAERNDTCLQKLHHPRIYLRQALGC